MLELFDREGGWVLKEGAMMEEEAEEDEEDEEDNNEDFEL